MKQEVSIKKNVIYNIIKNCSTLLFPLITFPYISRVLQPTNVGKIDFSNSIVSYFVLIAGLGITTYAIRECSAKKDDNVELSKKASQIFSINVWSTIISYLLLTITLIMFRKLDNYRMLIIIQSSVIMMSTMGTDWINSAMGDFRYITIRTFAFQFLSLILMLLFVRNENDYLNYAIISVISSSGVSLLNIWYRKKYCKISFTKELDLKYNLPPILILFVMMLAQTIFMNVDKTLIGIYKNDFEVGIYSTAVKVTNILSQLITSILWVIMPKMSLYFERKDYVNINSMLRKILGFNIILGLPCTVGVTCLSNEIVRVIAGKGYEGAVPVLQILMIAVLIRFFGGGFIGNIIMLPMKKEKLFMIACVISTIVNIVLNVFFIGKLGAVGAAITTAFSELLILLILAPKIDKRIMIKNKLQMFISPIVACVGIVIVCVAIKCYIANVYFRIILCSSFGCLVYFMILLAMKNEFVSEIIFSFKKKLKRG